MKIRLSAVMLLALAQTGAPEIKSQNRKSEAVQCLHGVKHDLVVQRPSK